MAYTPTTWTDEIPGETPVKYVITGANSDCTIDLKTAPTVGTPVNATNLNHIEQGIATALTCENRQGGSATNWDTPGTNNYTPSNLLIQCGSAAIGSTGDTNITFPVAYSNNPIVVVTSMDVHTCASVITISTTYFGARMYDTVETDPSKQVSGSMSWISIGPA